MFLKNDPQNHWVFCIKNAKKIVFQQPVNANTTEILTKYLLPVVPQIRISDRFESPELATDFLETNMSKLNLLVQKGRESFRQRETELNKFFNNYGKD